MVDISNYDLRSLTSKIVKTEEFFLNSYFNACLENGSAIISTQRMRIILDAKYKNYDLNMVIAKTFQHINGKKHRKLLAFLKRPKYFFGGTLGTWKTTPLDL